MNKNLVNNEIQVKELLNQCEKAYGKHDYSRLYWLCNEILKQHKNNETALSYKLYIYCDWRQYHLVFRIADQIHILYPNNCHAYNAKAIAYMGKKEFEKALDACNEGLEIRDYWWLRINKIEALISLNRIDEAHEFFNSSDIPDYNFTKALINCGKYSEISKYEEGLSDEELLGYYFKRCSFLDRRGNPEEILKVCEEILKIDKDNEYVLEYKIHSLASLERDEETLKCCDHAIKLYPDNFRFYFEKAETLLLGLEDADGAIKYYEKGFALVEDFDRYCFDRDNLICALNKKADELIESGKCEEAVYIYDKILFYKPKEFEALDNIDSLIKQHDINYDYSKNYKESLKLRMKIKNRLDEIAGHLKEIEIGKYDEEYVNGCSEFKDYNSIDEYIRDIIICLMDTSYGYDEESSKELLKYGMENVKCSFEIKQPAYDFAVVYGFSGG